MPSPERPSKQDVFLALLREGWTSLHLDARRPGVKVPAHLRGEAHLVLQYGHDLPIPIPDLEADEYGVRATLSFAKTPHQTVVPWEAVYVVACIDGRGVLYHEDVPEDVSIVASRPESAGAARAAERDEGAEPGVLPEAEVTHEEAVGGGTVRAGRAVRALRSVPADAQPDPTLFDPVAEKMVRRRRRPQLRLVK